MRCCSRVTTTTWSCTTRSRRRAPSSLSASRRPSDAGTPPPGSGAATSTSPTPTRRCGSSSARSWSCTTRRCGPCRKFVPASLDMAHVVSAPPCIDPLSVKNLELAMPFCQELTKQYGVDVNRPIVCQVSRFDPWKDPVGVIEAFRIVRGAVAARSSCSPGRWPPTTPRGSRSGTTPRLRAPATATSTSCRTCIRWVRCRSMRFPAPCADVAAEIVAGGLRPHRERGPLEGSAGDRRAPAASSCRSAASTATWSTRSKSAPGPSTCWLIRWAPARARHPGPRARARENFLDAARTG